MYYYTAYGLRIQSEVSLPELLPAAEAPSDVMVQLGPVEAPVMDRQAGTDACCVDAASSYFYWKEVGAFSARRGRTVTIDPLPGVEEGLVRLPLLGPVFGTLLMQRGYLMLHASAVAMDGGAVAFIARKGWGKSTMAATLYGRGHRVLTDDLLALNFDASDTPVVVPGFPQLKLWPEAAAASLGDVPSALPLLHHRVEKRARTVREGFQSSILPLKHLFVLDQGDAAAIEPVAPGKAFIELVRHTYSNGYLHPAPLPKAHFHQCSALVRQVPVSRLRRRVALNELPRLAELIEAYIEG